MKRGKIDTSAQALRERARALLRKAETVDRQRREKLGRILEEYAAGEWKGFSEEDLKRKVAAIIQ